MISGVTYGLTTLNINVIFQENIFLNPTVQSTFGHIFCMIPLNVVKFLSVNSLPVSTLILPARRRQMDTLN